MSDNIIGFKPKREDMVLECVHCEGQTYYVLSTGHIQCSECGKRTEIVSLNNFKFDKEGL